jgi:hypothetical protein
VVLEFDHLRDKNFNIGRSSAGTATSDERLAGASQIARDSPGWSLTEQTKDPANRALRLACSRGTDWGKPVLILGYPGDTG